MRNPMAGRVLGATLATLEPSSWIPSGTTAVDDVVVEGGMSVDLELEPELMSRGKNRMSESSESSHRTVADDSLSSGSIPKGMPRMIRTVVPFFFVGLGVAAGVEDEVRTNALAECGRLVKFRGDSMYRPTAGMPFLPAAVVANQ